jgi:hypothetical protein
MCPSTASTLTQLSIAPASGPMGDDEVMVLETTFAQVLGPIVSAMEGDTEVMDAQFLYQDIFNHENRRLEDEAERTCTENGHVLQADLLVTGQCRDCTSPQFGDVVNKVIENNLVAFQNKLRLNGIAASSEFFDNVSSVTFAVPPLPDFLPPIEDDTIFDSEPPTADAKQPWFLFLGLALGLCSLQHKR